MKQYDRALAAEELSMSHSTKLCLALPVHGFFVTDHHNDIKRFLSVSMSEVNYFPFISYLVRISYNTTISDSMS